MTPSRWQQIEELYHAALECEPSQRDALLERADPELRREVEFLLAQDSGGTPIDRPAWEGAASLLTSTVATLTPGTQLGPYKIEGPLGSGGMGEVFRARDTRLGRPVAVKTSREQFSARFNREARAISSLNHPNICTLYDVGPNYLVMELCEGETLAARLKRGKLSIEDTLRYGAQIADALAAAHAKGIVHRDLKPGNIMLSKSAAKVLDFGLARVQAIESGGESVEPYTRTQEGAILGTLQYMAPEQLEGKQTDARADIFAFGAVLYEMATGKKAFEGKTRASIVTAILEGDPPPLTALVSTVPAALDRAVKKCLEKDPDGRWQTALDLRDELKWIAESGSSSQTSARVAKPPNWLGRAATLLLVGALVAGLIFWRVTATRPVRQQVMRMTIPVPVSEPFATWSPVIISHDGTRLLFETGLGYLISRAYVRYFDRFEATQIRGVERAHSPFFSPDGNWLGYAAGDSTGDAAGVQLMKVPVTGGAVEVICATPGFVLGADWGADATIVFGSDAAGLLRVPASGGRPQQITILDKKKGELSHRWPQILPGGKAVLFTVQGPAPTDFHIAVESLSTHQRRSLTTKGTYARYSSSGHLVYAWEGSLLASPFDIGRLEVTGPEVSIVDNLLLVPGGGAQFALSDNGSLVYAAGGAPASRTLVWVDPLGRATPLAAQERVYEQPRLSPDGQRLAVGIADGSAGDIWTYDLARDAFTRLTYGGLSDSAVWSPDGKSLVFSSTRTGKGNLFMQAADGSGQAERLFPSDRFQWPGSFSPDGRSLAFMEFNNATLGDISVLSLQGERRSEPLLRLPATQWGGRISPNGRWLAYVSDETGRFEVYITSFPSGQGKWQISTEGGSEVVWSRNGRDLYWRNGFKMMTVGVEPGSSLTVTKPKLLFTGYRIGLPGLPEYDIAPEGNRFLMIKPNEAEAVPTELNVVVNWFEELKNRSEGGLAVLKK